MVSPPTNQTPPNGSFTRQSKIKLTSAESAHKKATEAAIKRYLSNPLLKSVGQQIDFNQKQLEEYVKCSEDSVYFVSKWVKIVNVDHGLVSIDLYPKQREMISTCQQNRFVILNASRQIGKTTTVAVGYILWY